MSALFVNNLTVIDCSYLDDEQGLVGESWIVDLVLHGHLDEQGMVFDFGHVKKAVKAAIDDQIDHKLLIPARSSRLQIKPAEGGTEVQFRYGNGQPILHRSPEDALCRLPAESVTAEAVAGYARWCVQKVVPKNVRAVEISLRTEQIDGAWYRYSHGLQKHDGNCQRIAHGHRSAVHILLDGERNDLQEKNWAAHWQDIYVATRDYIEEECDIEGVACYRFAYQAQQGWFELTLPQSRCALIETDSTVEWIAEHIRATVQQQLPENKVKVRAFEGVQKGALA
jgi:6-pyruvoyl-tetrahydropterin synthase